MPQKISSATATLWINHYLDNTTVPPGVEKTESVLFDFSELSEAIRVGFPPDGSTNPQGAYGFICHFARYKNTGEADIEDRNHVVIEFVKRDSTGAWIPISNQVWNFGGLKPPR